MRICSLVPVPGISSIQPDSTIILTDGRQLKSIDVIIFATGFTSDPATILGFSQEILDRMGYNPKRPHHFPRYRYQLTLGLPELSLFNQSYALVGAPVGFDIRSMWIAGVWSGNVKLPPKEEMEKRSKKEAEWLDGLYKLCVLIFPFSFTTVNPRSVHSNMYAHSGSVTPGTIPIGDYYLAATEAGCADDHYSWFSCTWDGWKWWWNNRALSRLLMDGPDIPASHRLRGRKRWEGAEEIIWRANGKVKPGKPAL